MKAREIIAKLKELKDLGVVSHGVFYLGGFVDCSKLSFDYTITPAGLNRLKKKVGLSIS